MDPQDYKTLLEQLEADLRVWPAEECVQLLGVLERVRVSAWSRLLWGHRQSKETSTEQNGRRLLTLPQVAERLAVPQGYAYELARRGILPVVRLGKYVRVPETELETWVAQQTSLDRKIDGDVPDLYSARRRYKRSTRIHAGISGLRTGTPGKNTGLVSSKVHQKTQVGFRPPVTPSSSSTSGRVQRASSEEGRG